MIWEITAKKITLCRGSILTAGESTEMANEDIDYCFEDGSDEHERTAQYVTPKGMWVMIVELAVDLGHGGWQVKEGDDGRVD